MEVHVSQSVHITRSEGGGGGFMLERCGDGGGGAAELALATVEVIGRVSLVTLVVVSRLALGAVGAALMLTGMACQLLGPGLSTAGRTALLLAQKGGE